MRKCVLAILIIAFVLATGCAYSDTREASDTHGNIQTAVPSVSQQPPVPPVASAATNSPSPEGTSSITAWPVLDWAEAGTYIPERMNDEEFPIFSQAFLYEDEHYIYYRMRYGEDLISIAKEDGDVTIITDNCCTFTVHDGKIYYSNINSGSIEVYDVSTGAKDSLLVSEEIVEEIVYFNGRLIFTCTPDMTSGERGLVLFSSNIDGTGVEKLGGNVNTFCVYMDKLYMITMGDLGYIHQYDFVDKVWEKIHDGAVSDDFGAGRGWLFCYEHTETRFKVSYIISYNVSTGETRKYSPVMYNNIAGQYIIFIERDENDQVLLNAYDFVNELGYTLSDITQAFEDREWGGIHITQDSIYLCVNKPQFLEIYVINVRDGKAEFRLFTTLDYN